MGDFFGILLFFIFAILLFMGISKMTNMSIGYRGKGTVFEPDDLDNIYDKSRKLVDKKYKNYKDIESKFYEEYEPIDRYISKLIFDKILEERELKEKGIAQEIIDNHIEKKYELVISEMVLKCCEIKIKYVKLAGRTIKIKK